VNGILSLAGVSKSFDATEIIRSVDLDIIEGERHAIIGPNGAGKSTLYNLITGRYAVSKGSIRLRDRELTGMQPFEINRLGLARSFQVTNIFPNLTVFENIRCGLMWSMQCGYSFWHLLGRQKQLNERSEQVLQQIGLSARRGMLAGVLTYAEQRALELGITIAGGADVILLDEPVAGMSHTEADQSVELIKRITEGKTLVVVEHDMGVVFNLADRISVLVYGEMLATGAPEEIRNNRNVQEAYLGSLDEQHA
jgi:branched-chain amino acid transport system ATP-binding protein|tara:strand:- start:8581 stop:9339 length:759 start_codon:yes stop_codon:yes gene_type:complete